MSFEHVSVLLSEIVKWSTETAIDGDIFVDLTFGGGGHSKAILDVNSKFKIIGFDQDISAIENAKKTLESYKNIELIHSNYVNSKNHLKENSCKAVIIDLGVSSHQFDVAKRGFSFRFDGPLDMRMNQQSEDPTAADIVNNSSVEELERIFKEYGEERYSKRVAENIVSFRNEQKKIETTKELENIVFHSYPKKFRYGRTHPATKVFQALRIEVNKELEVLSQVLDDAFHYIKNGGRILVISFHSLEDRLVKQRFKSWFGKGRIHTKRPLIASDEERERNPRSRSAKLRVFEKNET